VNAQERLQAALEAKNHENQQLKAELEALNRENQLLKAKKTKKRKQDQGDMVERVIKTPFKVIPTAPSPFGTFYGKNSSSHIVVLLCHGVAFFSCFFRPRKTPPQI
jgi:hypothetical protein